ncbi:unnamed protein product, partial [Owenia fusiformis]
VFKMALLTKIHFSKFLRFNSDLILPRLKDSSPLYTWSTNRVCNRCKNAGSLHKYATRGFRSVSKTQKEPSKWRLLRGPLAFTTLVTCGSFTGCSILQYERMRSQAENYLKGAKNSADNLFRKSGSFREHMNHYWSNLSPGKKMVAGIIGINSLVFLLWRIPAAQGLMMRYFLSSPFMGASSLSMLGSVFSHRGLFHFGANMYVLWSFTDVIEQTLGKEQFLAVYLSAGVISSFTSYAYKVARMSTIPSLGASGAVIALIGMTCIQYPKAQLSIAFIGDIIPHSFSAQSAMIGLLALDTMGVLMRWKLFDHAAHLGGMLFGIWYISYGKDIIWKGREPLIKYWHKIRGNIKR